MYFSPGPMPGASGMTDASRKASCTLRSPSLRLRACMSLISGAAAVISPARAVISLRASSRSISVSGLSASPTLMAAALSRCTQALVIISTAATSAMSRIAFVCCGSGSFWFNWFCILTFHHTCALLAVFIMNFLIFKIYSVFRCTQEFHAIVSLALRSF